MAFTKGEKAAFYDYICKYANDIDKHEGEFHLENQDVQAFLSKNDIYIVEGLGKNKGQKTFTVCCLEKESEKNRSCI